MIRNTIKALASALTIVLLAAVLCACAATEDEHSHVWDDGVVIEASTCTQEGSIKYTCSICGESFIKGLDLALHEYSSQWSSDEQGHWKQATCGCDTATTKENHYYTTAYKYDQYYHWKTCSACNYVGEKAMHEATEQGYCEYCGVTVSYTEGLDFKLSEDQQYYTLKGRGSALMEELVIPAYVQGKPVRKIAIGAFESTVGLLSVSIPETVEEIGAYAFNGCGSLAAVYLGDNVNYIGENAFSGTDYLVYNQKGNVKYLGNQRNPYHAIIGVTDKSIASCDIQAGARVVAAGAFEGCTQLVKVNVLDLASWCEASVSDYKSGPFYSGATLFRAGKKLDDLIVPDSVGVIGRAVFAGARLGSVSLSGASVGEYAFAYSHVKSVSGFGESVGRAAFMECKSLTTANLSGASSIEEQAFSWCDKLTSVSLDGVESIGESAFLGDGAIAPLEIPSSVKTIGKSAFKGCFGLTALAFRSGVESIGESAFEGCAGLHTVFLPEGLEEIGESAFKSCGAMNNIVFPSTLSAIGKDAFKGNKALTLFFTAETLPEGLAEGWNAEQSKIVLGGNWSVVNGFPTENE